VNDAEDFFLRECAAHARTLPVPQAILYLRGLLLSLPENMRAVDPIRGIYDALIQSDHQLDLIHSGQMKLSFFSDEVTASKISVPKKRRKREGGNGN
jgi:hypothetical protein